jgi:hypothetical protein
MTVRAAVSVCPSPGGSQRFGMAASGLAPKHYRSAAGTHRRTSKRTSLTESYDGSSDYRSPLRANRDGLLRRDVRAHASALALLPTPMSSGGAAERRGRAWRHGKRIREKSVRNTKGLKRGGSPGRKKGTPNTVTTEAKAAAARLVDDRRYRPEAAGLPPVGAPTCAQPPCLLVLLGYTSPATIAVRVSMGHVRMRRRAALAGRGRRQRSASRDATASRARSVAADRAHTHAARTRGISTSRAGRHSCAAKASAAP